MIDHAYNALGTVAGILAAAVAFAYITVSEFRVR